MIVVTHINIPQFVAALCVATQSVLTNRMVPEYIIMVKGQGKVGLLC